MNNQLTVINQDAKLVLAKTKGLLDITNKILQKKKENEIIKQTQEIVSNQKVWIDPDTSLMQQVDEDVIEQDLLAFVNITSNNSLESVVAHLKDGSYKFDFILITDKDAKDKEWKLVLKVDVDVLEQDLLAFVNITTNTSLEQLVAHINDGSYKFDFILITDKDAKEKEWKLVIKKS